MGGTHFQRCGLSLVILKPVVSAIILQSEQSSMYNSDTSKGLREHKETDMSPKQINLEDWGSNPN